MYLFSHFFSSLLILVLRYEVAKHVGLSPRWPGLRSLWILRLCIRLSFPCHQLIAPREIKNNYLSVTDKTYEILEIYKIVIHVSKNIRHVKGDVLLEFELNNRRIRSPISCIGKFLKSEITDKIVLSVGKNTHISLFKSLFDQICMIT